jgi:hypothetical protein
VRRAQSHGTQEAAIAEAKIFQGKMSISQFAIPNRLSYRSTILSIARDAKRRDDIGVEKMHKNFSVGALFQNDTSLPEWMFRVSGLANAHAAHGGSAKRAPAAALTRLRFSLYVVGRREKRGSRQGVGNGSSSRTAPGAGGYSGNRSNAQLLC